MLMWCPKCDKRVEAQVDIDGELFCWYCWSEVQDEPAVPDNIVLGDE